MIIVSTSLVETDRNLEYLLTSLKKNVNMSRFTKAVF